MSTVSAPPVESKQETEQDASQLISRGVRARPLFDPEIVKRATKESFVKLESKDGCKEPGDVCRGGRSGPNDVFVIKDAITGAGGLLFGIQIALWLWFTVVFANFAEAMAEARGKAQADTLRKTKTDTMAKKLLPNGKFEMVQASKLRAGDVVYCEAGYLIPGDGEVIEGIASVDESVITGESAPVIRESGGDRSAVTGGTKVLSDHIKIRITSNPGETFLDRMIALVEGAVRQKTPNEIALNILIAGLTLIFLLAVATLPPYAKYAIQAIGQRYCSDGCRSRLPACVPDSDDDWRIAFSHWYRGHGSRDATQCSGHERKGGGGFGRCQYVASRQDRDDYSGQSPGRRIHYRRRSKRKRIGRCRSALQPCR